jgi:succinyl-diaminopimelate desuccinylase
MSAEEVLAEVLALTRELIARPSLTPDDQGCQKLIVDRLLPLGYEVEWFICGDVSNVLITSGLAKPSLWFLGHTDVVPTGPEALWTHPPFEPTQDQGMLYGRGAVDMKGAVAAMVVAMERFSREHERHCGQLGLLLTSDEEGPAVDGVVRVAEIIANRKAAPDYCLVGEPSSKEHLGDSVRIGRRGAIHARLQINGIQGHTAFPETLDNPVHRMAPFLTDLVAMELDQGDDEFPASHLQVAAIKGGTGARNVTPSDVVLQINFRNGPVSPAMNLKARLEALLALHDITNFDLQWEVSAQPFRSSPGELRAAVVAAADKCLQIVPDLNTGGGTSDGRFIAPLGSEVVELGLLNATIHQIDECVDIADLGRLSDTYFNIIQRLIPTV